MTIIIKKYPGESIQSLIRRFTKNTQELKEELRAREYYKKPSQIRYEKEKRRLYKIAHQREEVEVLDYE